jgi:hypothetical protein
MPVRVVSCYTYRTSLDSPWSDAHHSVNQFVDALKGRSVRGYGHVLVNRTLPKRRMEAASAHMAIQWFGEMAAQILAEQHVNKGTVLVPIPNCDCTQAVQSSRTAALAEAVARQSDLVEGLADVLRWDEVMPSASSEKGPRDPFILYAHLHLTDRLNTHRAHVLIDDVLTTGGHIRACAAFLRANGAPVRLVICGARSDATPQDDPFQIRVDELDDFVP